MFNTQAFNQVIEDIQSIRLSTIKSLFSLMMGNIPKPHLENPVFQDPEGSQKPFAPHYEQFIKPEIDTFEHQRIATLKSFGQRSFGALCLLVATVIMGIVFNVIGNLLLIDQIDFIILMAIATWCYLPVWRYKGSVKKTIFPPIFKFFGENFHYSPKALIGIDSFESSEILPFYTDYNRGILTDSVQGTYKNVTLDIVWAHLKQKHSASIHPFFKGLFICLGMNKRFLGKTIVKRDLGLMNWADKPSEELEKVNLEDPRFEEDFEVYASNQIEARYLLTPSFMERLQGLSNLFWGADVQASFYNQNLLLMIPLKKRYFSTGSIFQPATFTGEIQRILEEMNLIFKIIQELKLHEKTGV